MTMLQLKEVDSCPGNPFHRGVEFLRAITSSTEALAGGVRQGKSQACLHQAANLGVLALPFGRKQASKMSASSLCLSALHAIDRINKGGKGAVGCLARRKIFSILGLFSISFTSLF